jgi:hypothetical protein
MWPVVIHYWGERKVVAIFPGFASVVSLGVSMDADKFLSSSNLYMYIFMFLCGTLILIGDEKLYCAKM